jgi:RNA polymerase sigma factor (TIGR02999 family)
MPLVYRELRRLAAGFLRRERRDHTLQPTALVHEAYLSLVGQSDLECRSRAQFFAIAARLMREILVDHARRRLTAKRGGGHKVQIGEAGGIAARQPPLDLLALDEALNKLTALDPRQGRIVELRYFGGMSEREIAEVLEVSPITVKRGWRVARAMLLHELRREAVL